MVVRWTFWAHARAALIVLAGLLASLVSDGVVGSPAAAQDLERFTAPPGLPSTAETPHWDRFHDSTMVRAYLRSCLAGRTGGRSGDPVDCVGDTTEACQTHPKNFSTVNATRCVAAEHEAWDGVLNEAYGRAMEALSGSARTQLREAQRAWIDYRDAACDVWPAIFEGGSVGRLFLLDCLADQTGRRAIDLLMIADASEL